MKREYHDGASARKNFEEMMTKLFRAPKPPKKEKPPKEDGFGREEELMRLPRPCRLRLVSVRSASKQIGVSKALNAGPIEHSPATRSGRRSDAGI